MTTDALRNAELFELEAVGLEREAAAKERKAEARLQTTITTAAFVLGAALGFLNGFVWGMWKAFDILSKVIQ